MEADAKGANYSTVLPDVILLKEMNHLCEATKSFSTKFNFSLEETTLRKLIQNQVFAKYMDHIPTLSIAETRLPKTGFV